MKKTTIYLFILISFTHGNIDEKIKLTKKCENTYYIHLVKNNENKLVPLSGGTFKEHIENLNKRISTLMKKSSRLTYENNKLKEEIKVMKEVD